jgi:DnaK suppressor protein
LTEGSDGAGMPLLPGDNDAVDNVTAGLEAKKAELEGQLARISAPPEEHSGISFGKRVGEGTSIAVERIVQVDAHTKLQGTLADVNRALAKLEEESYGLCDKCGRDIAQERLEILPWAGLCVTCATGR